jgi:hypothetical protein
MVITLKKTRVVFILLIGWLAAVPAGAQQGEGLEITGFPEHTPPAVHKGDQIQLVVNILNKGKTNLKLNSVKPIPGPENGCGNPTGKLLAAGHNFTVICQSKLEKEGQYNVGVLVSWELQEKKAEQQSASKYFSQVTVMADPWFIRDGVYYASLIATAILLVIILAIVLKRIFPVFGIVIVLLFASSLTALVLAMVSQNATAAVAALSLLAVVGLLAITGEDFVAGLMKRILKVGPLEFAPLLGKTQDANIFKIREADFLKRQTTLTEILEPEERLDHYIEFHRLTAYSMESELLAHTTNKPPDEYVDKVLWLKALQTGDGQKLGKAFFENLETTYERTHYIDAFKSLFAQSLKEILKDVDRAPDNEKAEKIRKAITTLQDEKAKVLSPHFFVLLARLYLILREPHSKSQALSALYDGYSKFSNTLINSPIGEYLGELNNDFWSALKHDCKAVELAGKSEKQVDECYEKIKHHLQSSQDSPLKSYLADIMKYHEGRWRAKLRNWFKTLKEQMMNDVASDIAYGEIFAYEKLAREYAKQAAEADPEVAAYTDTLGLVKLRFANSPTGGKEAEIREAASLFAQAIQMAKDKDDELTLEEARLHYRQAIDSLVYR